MLFSKKAQTAQAPHLGWVGVEQQLEGEMAVPTCSLQSNWVALCFIFNSRHQGHWMNKRAILHSLRQLLWIKVHLIYLNKTKKTPKHIKLYEGLFNFWPLGTSLHSNKNMKVSLFLWNICISSFQRWSHSATNVRYHLQNACCSWPWVWSLPLLPKQWPYIITSIEEGYTCNMHCKSSIRWGNHSFTSLEHFC